MTMTEKNNVNNMSSHPWQQFPMMGGMYPQMPFKSRHCHLSEPYSQNAFAPQLVGSYPPGFGNRGPFYPSQFYNQGVGPHNMPLMGNPNFHPGGPAAMAAAMGFTAFTPGGKLEPFNPAAQQQNNNATGENKKKDGQGEVKAEPSESAQKSEGSNLPPLPPGPPPPEFNKPPLPTNTPPTTTPYKPHMGPISFNFGKRPNFNNVPNAFSNSNMTGQNTNKSSGAAKKRRKREKMNAMKRNSMGENPNGLNNSSSVMPPLPPGEPPISLEVPPPPPIISASGAQSEMAKPVVKNLPPPNFNANAVTALSQSMATNDMPEWPPSFKNYVRKCYEKCKTDSDRDRVDIILKKKTLNATNDGSLYFKDWDKEPLPLLNNEINALNMRPSYKKNKNGLNSSLASRLGPKKYENNKKNARKYSPPRSKSPIKKRRYRSSSSSDSDPSSDDDYRSSKGDKGNHRRNEKGGRGKSKFYTAMGAASVPVDEELLTKRAARFGKQSQNSSRGRKRFDSSILTSSLSSSINSSLLFEDTSGDFSIPLEKHVVGTCQNIEKPYLRLTAQPDSSAVRPADVLVRSLERVKDKWKTQQDYHYACEQLKSIRQDLTVQGIRDEFTVQVYEMHARIALERGDHAEFNQCQSQLKLLYSEVSDDIAVNKREFMAYRILYYIFTKEFMDLTTQMALLSKEDKEDECIAFSLKVQSSWWLGNYHRLFKLYRSAPKMTSYLMDWFLLRERRLAIKAIIKSYRQVIPVSFVHQELAFDAEKDCLEFLRLLNVILIEDEELKIDCKASTAAMATS